MPKYKFISKRILLIINKIVGIFTLKDSLRALVVVLIILSLLIAES
jgi:hypothetical protein